MREVRDYIVAQLRQFQQSSKILDQESVIEAISAGDQPVVSALREIKLLLSKRFDEMEERLNNLESKMN